LTSAWAFAVAAWKRPGVEATCLELQDVHGQCAALLLWRLWTLMDARAVDLDTLDKALHAARHWEDEVLRPLRAVRRQPAAPLELPPYAAQAALRRKLLDAELKAEHALIDTLEALAPKRVVGQTPPLPALVALAQAWRPPAPVEALDRLIAAL
jgi:uncharacterized protein (TIGR02444 family)